MLWDVDLTLLDAGGAGAALFRRAFTEMFGRPFPAATTSLAGRTDRAIALEILTWPGCPSPAPGWAPSSGSSPGWRRNSGGLVAERGRVLPGRRRGARGAGRAGRRAGGPVGADREHAGDGAAAKLAAFGLDRYLDLAVGAYGDDHEIRADLVPLARAGAAAAHGARLRGRATVLIGDTPLDIEAARLSGARSVGVASGGFSLAELDAAGADAVLPGLADTARVLAAIGVG